MFNRNTTALSLPKSEKVRGYEIKRLALGGYLNALDLLQAFPTSLIEFLYYA
jgi:hypothetical protein